MPAHNRTRASMTMNWILLNIPLGILMVAFTLGLPLWITLKFVEGEDDATAHPAALRTRERTGPAGRNIYQLAATAEHYPSAAA